MRLIKNEVYIGLGSNLGDSCANLAKAVFLLEKNLKVKAILSSIYRSEPVELVDQPWFYNQAALFQLDPELLPTGILQILKEIEKLLGREPGVRHGPRLIDLDLLVYQNWVFESSNLTVPHPKLEERSFVLQPLLEISPGLINPRTGKRLSETYTEKRGALSICQEYQDK